MDHGTWPFLTTMLYINQSGDLKFLFEDQVYFKDCHIMRSAGIDTEWKSEDGSLLKDGYGNIYRGSVLEHLLVQNLVPFFNVGANNNIKIEGADWNDAFDMAETNGESVAFTALYGSNLIQLGELLLYLQKVTGKAKIQVAIEISILLDTISKVIDYDSVEKKLALRDYYFNLLQHFSGKKAELDIAAVANDLIRKGSWIAEHIKKCEWIRDKDGFEWFNGYYDNNGKQVEGSFPSGTRMTLTGQVFTVMGGIATDDQVDKVVASADKYLYDEKLQGYRLNTMFGGLQPNIGRCFGFAYGHKENGAVFSHMAVMYGNALYKRGHVTEGYRYCILYLSLAGTMKKAGYIRAFLSISTTREEACTVT
jgi:cellobiose phosphorylase